MSAIASIRYDNSSVTLNNTADGDGDKFILSDIDGWGSPEMDVQLINRLGNGSSLGKARYSKREITIHGMAIGNRFEDGSVFRAKRKVENWFADFQWNERWLYVDLTPSSESRQVKVIPGGELHFGTPKANMVEFEIPFTSLDPAKYSLTNNQVAVSGSATLTNGGNFPTYLYAVLLSGATNPYVEVNGQRLPLNGSMPAGVTVDFLNRVTTHPSNGIQDLAMVPRSWPVLNPGANSVSVSGSWRLDYRDAWR
jgi:phage-related protein